MILWVACGSGRTEGEGSGGTAFPVCGFRLSPVDPGGWPAYNVGSAAGQEKYAAIKWWASIAVFTVASSNSGGEKTVAPADGSGKKAVDGFIYASGCSGNDLLAPHARRSIDGSLGGVSSRATVQGRSRLGRVHLGWPGRFPARLAASGRKLRHLAPCPEGGGDRELLNGLGQKVVVAFNVLRALVYWEY